MKKLIGVLTLALVVGLTAGLTSGQEKEEKDPEAIKKAMEKGHKSGLMKKVAQGEGSDAEKKELLTLYVAMSKIDPPQGDADEWKKRTTALVTAAKGVVEGKEGAGAALTKAANCAACHKAHKPPA